VLGRDALSLRERECLTLICTGQRNKRIADRLGISQPTVEYHLSNARRKLGAKNREQTVAIAVRLGLVDF